MPAVTVEFNGEASDLIAAAKQSDKALDGLRESSKSANAQMQQSANATAAAAKKSSTSWTEFRSMYSSVLDVVRIGVTAFKATVDAAQEYDQQVKDMMLSTGTTADETSRLLQVVDDTGIAYDDLKIAMKNASKDGIEGNIDSLARLSDEYLSLAPGVERTNFLMDTFGTKTGPAMARAMDMGGDALRRMGEEMKGGLILTEENIKASEEYRVNVDELSDSWSGFTVTLGNEAIPALNDLIQMMQTNMDMAGEMSTFWDDLNQIMEDYAPGADRAAAAMKLLGDNAAKAMNKNLPSFMEDTSEATDSATRSYMAMAEAMGGATSEQEDLTDAMKETADANRDLLSLTMDIQSEYDSWQGKIQDLSAEHVALDETLALLGERTAKNATEWDKATAALDANGEAAKQLAADHDKAMKKIAADLYIAKLSVDGLTDAEYNLAIQALITSGQIDQATADMARNFEGEVAEAVRVAKDEVVTLGRQARGLATSYYMNFIASLTLRYSGGSGGAPTQVPDAGVDNTPDGDTGIPAGSNGGGDYGGATFSGKGGSTGGNADIIAAIYTAKNDLIRGLRDIMLQAAQ